MPTIMSDRMNARKSVRIYAGLNDRKNPIECGNICQIEWQIDCPTETQNVPGSMPDRVSDRMPNYMIDRLSVS